MPNTGTGFYSPDNYIEALGRVVKISPKTETHTILVLSTASSAAKAFPHFSVHPDLVRDFHVGDCVKVTGHIHLQKYTNNGRAAYGQSFIADTVEPVPSLLKQHFSIERGKFHETSFFRAYLHGKVTRVETDHGYDRIWISVPGDIGRNVIVKFSQKSGFTIQKAEDEMYTVMGVTTNIREKDANDRGYIRYENLVSMESYVPGSPEPVKKKKVIISINQDAAAEADAQREDDLEEYANQEFIL